MHFTDLESLIEEELRRLPRPVAPVTLFPRVMAQARRLAARPWYRKPWRDWPTVWQVVSAACVVAVCGLCAGALEHATGAEIPALVEAAGTVWRFIVEPNAAYLAAVAGLMGIATVLYCATIVFVIGKGVPSR